MSDALKKRSSNEPQDWLAGQAAAREARAAVGQQLAALLVERDMTGDKKLLVRRLRQLASVEAERDQATLRAAVMEVCVAAAAWVVSLDLRQRW